MQLPSLKCTFYILLSKDHTAGSWQRVSLRWRNLTAAASGRWPSRLWGNLVKPRVRTEVAGPDPTVRLCRHPACTQHRDDRRHGPQREGGAGSLQTANAWPEPSLTQCLFVKQERSMTQEANLTQQVKNSSATQETQDQSLGQEDPLEEEMATHSSVLAWRIPRTEEPGGLQSKGSQNMTKHSACHPCIVCILSVPRSQCSEELVPPNPGWAHQDRWLTMWVMPRNT